MSTADDPNHPPVVGFSISFEKDDLAERGLAVEQLVDMLARLAGRCLGGGHHLAYGGDWGERPDNFTYVLLELIRAGRGGSPGGAPLLYNHLAWPFYLNVTPSMEAKWSDCCRIVRIGQAEAGIAEKDRLPDERAIDQEGRPLLFSPDIPPEQKRPLNFNAAVCLGAMRRATMQPRSILIPETGREELIPPVAARIVLGGKTSGHVGFMPGIFEEALITLQARRPLLLLGGFGGCAEVMARAIAEPDLPRPGALTLDWQRERTPGFGELLDAIGDFPEPEGLLGPEAGFDALWRFIEEARAAPAATLRTGLDDDRTRRLLSSRDGDEIIALLESGGMISPR